MCSIVLFNSLKILNRNPKVIQYGKQISAAAVYRGLTNVNKSEVYSIFGVKTFKELLLQTVPSPVTKYRMYSDVASNTERVASTKENESQEISKDVGEDKVEDVLKESEESTTQENVEGTPKERTPTELKMDELAELAHTDIAKQGTGQDKSQQEPSKIRSYYLEFERLLYLFIAASIDVFYAILASNELKLIKLSALRAYNYLKASFQKYVVENPAVQNKLNEIKANVEKARREDANKS